MGSAGLPASNHRSTRQSLSAISGRSAHPSTRQRGRLTPMWVLAACLALSAAPLADVCLAGDQSAAAQPEGDQRPRSADPMAKGLETLTTPPRSEGGDTAQPPEGSRYAGRWGRFRLSEEERADYLQWRAQNMPNLESRLGRTQRSGLVPYSVSRWRELKRAEADSPPEVVEAIRERLRKEDAIFGLVTQYESAPEDQRPAIRELIHNAVTDIMGAIFEARENRLEELRQQLEKEEEKLQNDREKFEEIIHRRVAAYLGELSRPDGGDGNRNDGGRDDDDHGGPEKDARPNGEDASPKTSPARGDASDGDKPRGDIGAGQ